MSFEPYHGDLTKMPINCRTDSNVSVLRASYISLLTQSSGFWFQFVVRTYAALVKGDCDGKYYCWRSRYTKYQKHKLIQSSVTCWSTWFNIWIGCYQTVQNKYKSSKPIILYFTTLTIYNYHFLTISWHVVQYIFFYKCWS